MAQDLKAFERLIREQYARLVASKATESTYRGVKIDFHDWADGKVLLDARNLRLAQEELASDKPKVLLVKINELLRQLGQHRLQAAIKVEGGELVISLAL